MSNPLSSTRPERPTVVDLTDSFRNDGTETFRGVIARPEGSWLVVTFPPDADGVREGRMWPAHMIDEVTAREVIATATTGGEAARVAPQNDLDLSEGGTPDVR